MIKPGDKIKYWAPYNENRECEVGIFVGFGIVGNNSDFFTAAIIQSEDILITVPLHRVALFLNKKRSQDGRIRKASYKRLKT